MSEVIAIAVTYYIVGGIAMLWKEAVFNGQLHGCGPYLTGEDIILCLTFFWLIGPFYAIGGFLSSLCDLQKPLIYFGKKP